MQGLEKLLKDKHVSLQTKTKFVNAMIFPVILYGCDTWTGLDLTGGWGLNPLAHNADPPSLLEISTPGGRIIQAFNPPRSVFSTHFDLQMAMLKDCIYVLL